VDVKAGWRLVATIENPSTATTSFTESLTQGYSETESDTTTDKWSVNAGLKVYALSVAAGFEHSVSHTSSETWSSSTTKSVIIQVKPQDAVTLYQRTLKVTVDMGEFYGKACEIKESTEWYGHPTWSGSNHRPIRSLTCGESEDRLAFVSSGKPLDDHKKEKGCRTKETTNARRFNLRKPRVVVATNCWVAVNDKEQLKGRCEGDDVESGGHNVALAGKY